MNRLLGSRFPRNLDVRKSLVTRMVVGSLAVGVTTIVLVGIVAFDRARFALRQATLERLTTVALLNERQLADWIDRQREVVEFLAGLPEVVETARAYTAAQPAEVDAVQVDMMSLIADHAPGFPDLRELFVMTPVGGAVFASSNPERVGEYRVADLFFTEGRSGTLVQNVYPSPVDGRPTMTVGTPVWFGEEMVAVLAAHLELERVDETLEQRAGLGTTGEAYLVSAYNDFVSAARFGREGHRRGAHSDGIRSAIAGTSGASGYLNYRGEPVFGAYRWVPERELAVVAEIERREVLAPLSPLLRTIVGIAMLSVLLLAIGTAWMAKKVASPILAIAKAATQVASGDFTTSAPVLTEDEVGRLAVTFNGMTAQLQSVYQDLNKQAQRRETALADLAAAKDEAERANQAKSSFLAMMSHEIRTPMNGVLGMTEVLLTGALNDEQRDQAETIRTSGRSLLTVIDDILDFSKIEAGEFEIDDAPFDVRRTIQDVIALLRPRAIEAGLDLDLDVAADVPRTLLGDAGRIRQILLNLTGNALKFTDQGSVRLTVEVVRSWTGEVSGGDLLRIAVSDTGIGIPVELQSRLFHPFRQADSSTTRRFGGTGLGLAISKQLSELMGGSIHLKSQPEVGSRFWVELPLRVAQGPEHESQVAPPLALDHIGSGLSVLVVEDNPINQKVAEALLTRLGCSVATAANGLEGIEAIEARAFDVVFMDCQMPAMDGFEATRIVRSREASTGDRTPIVAMTANAMAGDREACLAAGMDDYVTKPIEVAEVGRVLNRFGRPAPDSRRTLHAVAT